MVASAREPADRARKVRLALLVMIVKPTSDYVWVTFDGICGRCEPSRKLMSLTTSCDRVQIMRVGCPALRRVLLTNSHAAEIKK